MLQSRRKYFRRFLPARVRDMKRSVFSMAAGGAQSAVAHSSDLITFILCPEPKSKQKSQADSTIVLRARALLC